MASIIPGYEYDIFISYRQKDNKYDGWVTEFVNNLQRELEATFKEEISVYFDINPNNGLLETHDVHASLKEKLKCLIFVPIISRTYCDPLSFAWDNEFRAFIGLASNDKLGLKVKLPNGNIGSRVLPVRIYDLDDADNKLCESVLGGVLRGIDFVYREPGVNRPLVPDDDEKKNLNNTKYRNQINKTANAIKEIISGLKSEQPVTSEEKVFRKEPVIYEKIDVEVSKPGSLFTPGKVSGKNLLIMLIVLFIIVVPLVVFKLTSKRQTEKSISIPVNNPEAEKSFLPGSKFSYDAHMSIAMADKYKDYISFSSAIAEYDKAIEEDSLIAETYALRAAARAWGYYTRQLDTSQIVLCLADIRKAESLKSDFFELNLARGFYHYFCTGDLELAKEHFRMATYQKPGDEQPLFYLAMVYRKLGDWRESYRLTRKLIALDPREALTLTNIGLTYTYFHNWDSALMYHQKAIDKMPAWTSPYRNKIETIILKDGNIQQARDLLYVAVRRTGNDFTELKILLDIYEQKYADALKIGENATPADFSYRGEKYLFIADIHRLMNDKINAAVYYDSAQTSFSRELEKDRNNPEIHSLLGLAAAGLGQKETAVEEGRKAKDLIEYENLDKSDMILNLAKIYTITGDYEQAKWTIDYLLKVPLSIPSCFSGYLLKIDPVWQPLIQDPEYQALVNEYLKN